jgi:hypothetical protein
MRKVQEEERMEALERKIELEASSQIAKHNAQLSAGLFKDADQLRPRVVFEGHFQPGTDASSKSEAAAELAAWGPRSQLYWSKVKAEQRDEARRVHRPSDDAELSGSVNGADWGADGLVPGSGGARLAKSRQQMLAGGVPSGAAAESAAAPAAAPVAVRTDAPTVAVAPRARVLTKVVVPATAAATSGVDTAAVASAAEALAEEKVREAQVELHLRQEEAQNAELRARLAKAAVGATMSAKASPAAGTARSSDAVPAHEAEHKHESAPAAAMRAEVGATAAPRAIADAGNSETVRTPTGSEVMNWLIHGNKAQRAAAAEVVYSRVQDGKPGEEVGAQTPSSAGVAKAALGGQKVGSGSTADAHKLIKGKRRCCDTACIVVSYECPNTHALDEHVEAMVRTGKGPSTQTLQKWLVSGTQEQKDEAAGVLYSEAQGTLVKPAPKLVAKSKPSKMLEGTLSRARPGGGSHEERRESSDDHGSSASAAQADNLGAEAEGIVGDLTAQGH